MISAAVSVAVRHFLNSLPLKSIIKTRFHSIWASWPIFQKIFQGMKKNRNSILTFFLKPFFFLFHHFSQENKQVNGKFSCHHHRKTVTILQTHFANHTFDSKSTHFSLSCWHEIKTGGYTYFLAWHEISSLYLRPTWNYAGMKFHVAKHVYTVCGVYRETEMNSCRHEFHTSMSFHL